MVEEDGNARKRPLPQKGSNGAKQETTVLSASPESTISGSLCGGTARGALYTMKKLGVSSTIFHTFVKKKVYLLLGAQPAITSAYPSPVDHQWCASHRLQWRSTYPGHAAGKSDFESLELLSASLIDDDGKCRAGTRTELVKGSLIGIAVFGVYDILILRKLAELEVKTGSGSTRRPIIVVPQSSRSTQVKKDRDIVKLESMFSWHLDHQLPLYMHVQAGAMAGLIQSFVLDGWEISEYLALHHWQADSRKSHSHHRLRTVNVELILRRALHHSIGFATLFGCYELVRSSLSQSTMDFLRFNSHSWMDRVETWSFITHKGDGMTKSYNVTCLLVAITFFAGGVAGQAHFVVSHYLRQWKIGSLAIKAARKQHASKLRHIHWRPFLASFLPTGLSFLAFQYAGELTDHWLNSATET